MKGNKAMKRAMETKDAIRLSGKIPLIVDSTEEISPEIAQEILKKNKANRPINWHKVEEYADLMARGQWKLHSQGIIIDDKGNLLTGQKRLWAIVYSGVTIPMRSAEDVRQTRRILSIGEIRRPRGIWRPEKPKRNIPRSRRA